MPEYNFLTGNESDFPHVNNVNVYKYDNDFDYGRFDAPQMELQICSVPWDMGEAHIGARTISGIGNVVYFETKAKRDAWFDAIPDSQCYRFTTKFKELHRSLEIDVPVPYDMCAKHNYLRVKYNKLANDGSPIQYEGDDGLREWFWFIREVEFLAPNTTRLHLLDDAFQTWIYDVNVSGMVLERGHAPMFDTRANEFLADPLNNNTYLLTEDVNFGQASQVKHITPVVLNAGDVYACIATTGAPGASWNDRTVASPYYLVDGVPSVYVFAIPANKLNQFLLNVTMQIPQFKQTVQGVFFASLRLLTLGASFTFAGMTCYMVSATRREYNLCNMNKIDFGYPAEYADIAKLYTSPYAHVEITDENGNVDIIKVEDTTGTLKVNAAINLAYPFITIDAHVMGAGGSVSTSVNFRNVTERTFDIGGQWYDTLRSWNVPTFAVVLDAAAEYDYSTRFERAQAVMDYTTAQTNANASADTMKTNADAAADTSIANAALQTTANSGVATYNNAQSAVSVLDNHFYNNSMADNANDCISANATSTIAANEQQAAIGAASGAIQSAVSAVGAAATGNIGGAVTGLINGLVGSASNLASMQVANSLTATQAQNAQDLNDANATSSNANTSAMGTIQQLVTTETTTINNTYITSSTANNAATQKANASRDQATQKANAARTASAAQSAIDNGIAQAALQAPFMYGTFANGDNAATKPIGLFAHIVTQSKSAISRAGDEFLRYGYMFDGQWDFDGNWNVGKYFTYWKLRDFWVSNLNVPDMYMDKLRFFLFGGVTVWRSPEYIGNVTVYDNFN